MDYQSKRNILSTTIKNCKSKYLQKQINEGNPRKMWNFITHHIGNKNSKSTSSASVTCEELNAHFTTTAERLLSVTTKSIIEISYEIENNADTEPGSFSFTHCTIHEMSKCISKLKNNKNDYMNISTDILKHTTHTMATHLTTLYNKSIDESKFPEDLKYGCIIPIAKVNNASAPDQMRPICLLPTISKPIERMAYTSSPDKGKVPSLDLLHS